MSVHSEKPVWHQQIRWKLTLSYGMVLLVATVVFQLVWIVFKVLYQFYQDPTLDILQTLIVSIPRFAVEDLLAIPIFLYFGHKLSSGFSARLEKLKRAVDAWGHGDFTERPIDNSTDELGMLTRKLVDMADRLQETVKAEQELATARERNRIARDLHDTVKQQVFATQMHLSAAQNLLLSNPNAAKSMLEEAIELTHLSQTDLSSLIDSLPAAGLDHRSLSTVLREYIDHLYARGIDIQIRVNGDRDLPLEIEEAFFRIAQGALANVIRHSQARSALVELTIDDDRVLLRIADDGIGFDAQEPGTSEFGLESMRARISNVGGTLQVDSQIGTGTSVTAQLPLG